MTVLQAHTVVSSVSMRPSNQTGEHATTNVKEEPGNSDADSAKVAYFRHQCRNRRFISHASYLKCIMQIKLNSYMPRALHDGLRKQVCK